MILTEVEHRKGPSADEPPYSAFCTGCGLLWPCPDRIAAIDVPPPTPRRDLEAAEERILVRIGLCWHIEGREGLPYHQRNGGTVVGYEDDEDDERTFRFLTWHRGEPLTRRVACADVEPAGVHEPDRYVLEAHALSLAAWVGKGGGKGAERLEWLKMATLFMERACEP